MGGPTEPEVRAQARPDGAVDLWTDVPVRPPAVSVGAVLAGWARREPGRPFLAEPEGAAGWRVRTYGQVWREVRAAAAGLLARGAGPEAPVLLLSDNSLAHAVVQLACQLVGVPAVPLSPSHLGTVEGRARIGALARRLRPALAFAEDGARDGAALDAADVPTLVARAPRPGDAVLGAPGPEVAPAEVEVRASRVGPDTAAKLLLTSGSTGAPKAVIQTHGMLAANQASLAAAWPWLAQAPPLLVDWLPWSHTFGGNHDFNLVLWHGGVLHIDDGRPEGAAFERRLARLADLGPTLLFDVPRTFERLIPRLADDAALAARVLGRARVVFFAGAALSRELWGRLRGLVARHGPPGAFVACGWGATETGPMASVVVGPVDGPDRIGIPGPGTTVRLAPVGEDLELRVRGPSVTPGYWGDPEGTTAAFDADGFFRTGDAGALADPERPGRGLRFCGRLSESFKLSSGTWVRASALRLELLDALAPLCSDLVLAGPSAPHVVALVFTSPKRLAAFARAEAGRAVAPEGDARALLSDPDVGAAVVRRLAAHNAAAGGSSRRIARVALTLRGPDPAAGEITDKGYINPRRVRAHRPALFDALLAHAPGRAPLDGDTGPVRIAE